MTLISRYFPFEYVEDVFSIDYKRLYEKGYRGLVFDIDNTLVPHGADSTKEVDDLFVRIHETGLKTLLLSNNNEARIKRFLANIDTLYIYDVVYDLTLVLVDEDDEVVYSVFVPANTSSVVLPSWLEGDYQLLLIPDENYYFAGEISL